MLNFNWANLRKSHEGPWLLLDLAMLGLLTINLIWIVFDSLYATAFFKQALLSVSPWFVDAYQPIHANFVLIDLIFIAIFLAEFCLRWVVSVYRKEHLRWYFFPFLHWYDLIGCIPVSGARIFRLLRVFSILYRLHKYQIVDLRSTALFRFLAFYYNVFVEELTDRIVVKVITDTQAEIHEGSPIIDEILQRVLAPRKAVLHTWLASSLNHFGQSLSDPDKGARVRQHVKNSVGKAVKDNAQVSTLKLVPMIGPGVESLLEKAVTDIVTHSLINLLTEMSPQTIDDIIKQNSGYESLTDQALDQEVLLIVSECLEVLKQHVAQQSWKLQLDERSKEKTDAKLAE